MNSYVVLLLILWQNTTGEPVAIFEPVPVFTSMEKCLEVIKTAEPPPKGFSVTATCQPVEAPIIKDTTTVER
jgi:hypothetical protein